MLTKQWLIDLPLHHWILKMHILYCGRMNLSCRECLTEIESVKGVRQFPTCAGVRAAGSSAIGPVSTSR